jgi:hypothetical protein
VASTLRKPFRRFYEGRLAATALTPLEVIRCALTEVRRGEYRSRLNAFLASGMHFRSFPLPTCSFNQPTFFATKKRNLYVVEIESFARFYAR